MGYRHYFYLIEKEELDKIRGMTYDELFNYETKAGYLEDGDNYIFLPEVFNQKRIYEFGKLYWDDTAERIYSTATPMFENKETQSYFADFEPFVVGKQGVLEAIKIYREKILNYFKGFVKKESISKDIAKLDLKPENLEIDKICKEIQEKIWTWGNFWGTSPIDVDENNEEITNSWLYEYQIFELVRLYKAIDWEKYTVLFYGW